MSVAAVTTDAHRTMPRFAFDDAWPRSIPGLAIGDVGGVAVDEDDRVYVFHRGEHPMLVFDRAGHLLDAWGDGVFTSPHGLHYGWDGQLYCTDDGDHTVRRFDRRGRMTLEMGVRGRSSGFMSGDPFNRCTHCALTRSGEIVVTDGYRNARMHRYSSRGELLQSWGRSGVSPGEFHVPHNVVCDHHDTLYVADRENHRIQRFDTHGGFVDAWHDLHRPMALALWTEDGSTRADCYVGEAAPLFNADFPGLGPRISVLDADGRLVGRFGDVGYGHAADRFVAPHGIALDSSGNVYVGEVARLAWTFLRPGEPVPEGLRTLRRLRRVEGRAS